MFGTVMFSAEMFAGNSHVGATPPTPGPPTPPAISTTSSGPTRGKIVKASYRDSYAQGEAEHFKRQIVRRAWG